MLQPISRTKELIFSTGEIKTDSMLYRDKAYLLLPEPGTENAFTVLCDEQQTRFFISSSARKNLERLELFFFRIYGTIIEDSPVMHRYSSSLTIFNSLLNLRTGDFYHPRFIRNILDFPHIDHDIRFSYTVRIRSSNTWRIGRRRYNFFISIGFDSAGDMDRFRDLVANEILSLKESAKWRMRISRSSGILDNLLRNPFNLINFVRIPSESDNII